MNVKLHSWMCFIDGENFTLRAQAVAKSKGVSFAEGPFHKKDCFVWLPNVEAKYQLVPGPLEENALRASYYTSVSGDDELISDVRTQLWKIGFDAHVFKKARPEQKAKGVDIALTKDMLSHAFLGNYAAAVLIAGDGDYLPLVEEVKRLGKLVYVCFFQDGLNHELKLACDRFHDLTRNFFANWGFQ